ncbi:MAG: DUF4097 family beta strand repeat protein [Lachnospiraceae bacterium]|nr:DUF4097 family beta strand repeat protein [Lachnospiraceae bacterium]
MKKFFKWSAIIAGILLVVGLVLVFASTVMGGRQAVISVGENLKNVEWDELEDVLESAQGLEFNIGDSGLNITLNGEGTTELKVNGITISAGEQSQSFTAAEIRGLALSLGAGEFIIRTKDTDDGMIDLTVTGVGECKYYVEEGTLVVDGFRKNFGISAGSVSEVVLEIPAGMRFVEVDAEVGAGIMHIDNLQTRELETSIGAGELNLEKIQADEFTTQIGAGQVIAKEMDIMNAELDVSMGECIFEGQISGNLEAECDMGNLELALDGSQSEHNFQIECAAGNIDMEGFSVAGFAAEKTIDNGAGSEFEITCNMGNISIEFEEE